MAAESFLWNTFPVLELDHHRLKRLSHLLPNQRAAIATTGASFESPWTGDSSCGLRFVGLVLGRTSPIFL